VVSSLLRQLAHGIDRSDRKVNTVTSTKRIHIVTDPDSRQPTNVVGSHELIALQTFDIARLTTHAVPIIPGTFIAVSGVGPKGDSNGSGKTSFLAAVTVLLADPQWRLDVNGGQLAAGLLFKPDAAGLEASRVSPAPHGYIAGVFADPTDPMGVEIPLLTVWIRLSTTSPYLQARWDAGLHVADADNDDLRYEQADIIWNSMPQAQRCSARALQSTLYGDAPRCMAYLDTTLRRGGASLLSQQMTEMTPEAIGQSLIDLAGLRPTLEEEQLQRQALAEQQRALSEALASHERRLREEDAELAAVANRRVSRAALAKGALMWRLHFARRYVDIVPNHEGKCNAVNVASEELDDARANLEEAKEAHRLLADRRDFPEAERSAREVWEDVKAKRETNEQERAVLVSRRREIAGRRPGLVSAAEGWDGTPTEETEQIAEVARRVASDARARQTLAEETAEAARESLRQVEAGRPLDVVQAMSALNTASVPVVALADTLSINEPNRSWWEPIIAPWLSALVVAPDDVDRASTAVSHLPGTILVAADGVLPASPGQGTGGGPMPPGLTAEVRIGRFLAALASRHENLSEPPRALDTVAGITVVGGFETAIVGREAQIMAAQVAVTEADAKVEEARRSVRRAELTEDLAAAACARARATESLAIDDEEAARLDARISACDRHTGSLSDEEETALEAWQAARLLASHHGHQVNAAKMAEERETRAVKDAEDKFKKSSTERDALHFPYWRDGWGDTIEAAHRLLDEQDASVRRLTTKRLRNRAQEALKEAFDAYGADVDELPGDVRAMFNQRDDLADGDDPTAGSLTFQELSQPLQTRLDGSAERDATTETTVRLDRARRQATVDDLEIEVENRTGALETIQDMIEHSIEGHFTRMSEALNSLDFNRGGYGAELHVVSRRPGAATSTWQWQVSPRWRRIRDGKMINYREVANGAQVKVYAVQVTLAALLAADSTVGRVLVIDELGNSLGEVNRKDVLAALRQVPERQRVTILGTCQGSVLYDASHACGEILWFTHASNADAYNQPVRIWAHDADQGRVELTADWMRSFRPRA
jgi:hypothetical protein